MALVGSSSSSERPAQPPWISMLFPEGDFPPILPSRPQCLSLPGPRCSKLVPAQSFIDFKIEANSGLKKREREREMEARERQRVRDGRGGRDGARIRDRQGEMGTVKGREGQRQRARDRDSERERQKQTGRANYGSRKIYKNRALNPRDVALRRVRLC